MLKERAKILAFNAIVMLIENWMEEYQNDKQVVLDKLEKELSITLDELNELGIDDFVNLFPSKKAFSQPCRMIVDEIEKHLQKYSDNVVGLVLNEGSANVQYSDLHNSYNLSGDFDTSGISEEELVLLAHYVEFQLNCDITYN